MKTLLMSASSAEGIKRAAALLGTGELVAFPTDTVYGLGALAFDEAAVRKIYVAKERPADKAIPVLLSSVSQIDLVATRVGAKALRLAQHFWPGPLTIVVAKNQRIPDVVASDSVGLRCPDHPVARALIDLAGPLAVTSANLSGRMSPITAEQVLEQLDGRIALVLDGGAAPGGIPSTVVNCTDDDLILLRPGPLALQDLQAALR